MLGTLIRDLQSGRKNVNNPAVHGWSSKRDFLTLGKEDGLLYIRYKVVKRHVNQLVVPAVLIPAVLTLKHDHADHMGAEKTTSLIRHEYFWLSMVNDVKEYCKSCLACARSHPAPSQPSAPFTVTSQPQEPWQEIATDIKGSFGKKPTNNGNRYFLVVVDLLTCAVEMIPIRNKSAKTVASALIQNVFC